MPPLAHAEHSHHAGTGDLACEVHNGTLRTDLAIDPVLDYRSNYSMRAHGTCLRTAPGETVPEAYDVVLTDSGVLRSLAACAGWFSTESDGVSLELYDAGGAWSAASASGSWVVQWGPGLSETHSSQRYTAGIHTAYPWFSDSEGNAGGDVQGELVARALNHVDCAHNFGFRQLTFDGAFQIFYGAH